MRVSLLPIILALPIGAAGCAASHPKPRTSAQSIIKLEALRPLNLPAPLEPGRGAFVSAASGIARHQGALYYISDDENFVFIQKNEQPLRAFPIQKNPHLSVDPKQRKATKPDFEALLTLTQDQWPPYGALVAWPSGSTARRQRAILLPFRENSQLGDRIEIDLSPLIRQLTPTAIKLNIEGVTIHDQNALLVQRGNSKSGKNGIFRIPLKAWLSGLQTGNWNLSTLSFQELELGELHDVKLTLSDIIPTSQGLFGLASAEDTESTYTDGRVTGSALFRIEGDRAHLIGKFDPPVKLEGILLDRETPDGSLHFLLVDDADDPKKPSHLYRAKIHFTSQQKTNNPSDPQLP